MALTGFATKNMKTSNGVNYQNLASLLLNLLLGQSLEVFDKQNK